MESNNAIRALSALAQETRLAAFRMLVAAGPAGLPAGVIAERLKVPPATLSFHLQHLANAGLAEVRRAGRSMIYSADYGAMDGLVRYLMDNCCGGAADCGVPVCPPGDEESAAAPAARKAS